MPARKFGYAPSLPLAVRRLRRQLRHWVHKKVKALRAGPRKGPKILAADRPVEPAETKRKEHGQFSALSHEYLGIYFVMTPFTV
jgi:hypothetical protein